MKKALFLDRDGVINVEKNYLYKSDDFEFIDGIFDLILHFQNLGYLLFVVTNQSGIARNYYTVYDFNVLTEWMLSELAKHGINVQHVYYCPHHPDVSRKCSCRKPEPGMLLEAAKEYSLDLKNSIMIGDKERDIEAGLSAGLEVTYLFDESNKIKSSKAKKIVNKLEDVWK